jgi:hypothetical protein
MTPGNVKIKYQKMTNVIDKVRARKLALENITAEVPSNGNYTKKTGGLIKPNVIF